MMTNTAVRKLKDEDTLVKKGLKDIDSNIKVVSKSKSRSEIKVGFTTFQKIITFVATSIILFLIVISIMRYTTMSKLNRTSSSMDNTIGNLTTQRDYITVELEKYISNSEIESKAKELGMVYPGKDQIFVLDEANDTRVAEESSN